MNVEDFREYCISKKGVSESFPFDEDTLVFKVMSKIFAITSLSRIPSAVNLKCKPEEAIKLREEYDFVLPGYHMNKKHWNTIELENMNVSSSTLCSWIDNSYDLVVNGLTRKQREELGTL